MATGFPRRLFEILSTEDKSVVSWNADGKSFKINDTHQFCNDILPRYFRHCKLTSFQRQLNLYGFQRVHVGPLGGAYHHPCFQRDNFSLLMQMKRTIKRSGSADGQTDSSNPTSPSSASSSVGNDSLGTSLLSSMSFPSLPVDGSEAARRASDAVSAAAAAMSLLVTPFSPPIQQPPEELQQTQTPQENMKPKASTSSMDSQEWLRAAELHDYSHPHLKTREHSSESEHESLMDFDINQLEDNHHGFPYNGKQHSSPASSGLDILANVSEAESDDMRNQSWRHICGIPSTESSMPTSTSWAATEELVTPNMLERMVLDAHRADDQSWVEYEGLAENLVSTVGSKDALNLALALLARTSQRTYSSRPRNNASRDNSPVNLFVDRQP